MLNLHKLDIFLRVAELGSFSRAAESLLMTQSAVSHHIRDLERQLGSQLFHRQQRGVTLTEAGEKLQEYGVQITALIASAEQELTDLTQINNGEVHIGATPGISASLLPDCILLFQEEFPRLTVAMQTGTSTEVIELLQSGKIEVGIIEGELEESIDRSIQIQRIHDIQQKVIIGPKHPWWGRAEVNLAELDNQEFVMRQPNSQTRIWLDRELKKHHVHPHVSTVFDNIDSIKRSVIRSTGLTIMPAYSVQDELAQGSVQALSIQGQPLQRTLKLVWYKNRPFSPTATAFLEHVEECLANQRLTV